jgi:hypothetical protein
MKKPIKEHSIPVSIFVDFEKVLYPCNISLFSQIIHVSCMKAEYTAIIIALDAAARNKMQDVGIHRPVILPCQFFEAGRMLRSAAPYPISAMFYLMAFQVVMFLSTYRVTNLIPSNRNLLSYKHCLF